MEVAVSRGRPPLELLRTSYIGDAEGMEEGGRGGSGREGYRENGGMGG
eukprot:CAMPEP_0119306858 /NCGR_PEP_ID=MMETSP1333-20130426/7515_1 /TAXON_ID=418940 /ORGANISM="Scyphosphaera apsteinii, Strain RCC1455" /LENGTH=47 /DNA_ID= /DNA_START= /DNA_END= /DNA_ORIENTATION=